MTPPALHRHPAWFGSVMGTAGLSVAFLQESAFVGGTAFVVIASALLVVATLLALVLLPRYLMRPRDREAFREEISDPAQGGMLATFPGGLLVLAVAWARVGSAWLGTTVGLTVSAILVTVGAVTAIGFSVMWASHRGATETDLSRVNGGWLLPAVVSLLVPLSLAPQMEAHPDQAAWLLVLSLAFYGFGVVLFLALLTLLVARLALRPPLPHAMSPSLWIPLAPSGILGLSLLRLMQAGVETGLLPEAAVTLGIVVAAMGIGLGLWWALFALGDLLRVRRSGGLPFHPGWWGFVFPVAAMQMSLAALGAVLDSTAVQVVGLVGFGVLVVVWLVVAIRTSAAVVRHARSVPA